MISLKKVLLLLNKIIIKELNFGTQTKKMNLVLEVNFILKLLSLRLDSEYIVINYVDILRIKLEFYCDIVRKYTFEKR